MRWPGKDMFNRLSNDVRRAAGGVAGALDVHEQQVAHCHAARPHRPARQQTQYNNWPRTSYDAQSSDMMLNQLESSDMMSDQVI